MTYNLNDMFKESTTLLPASMTWWFLNNSIQPSSCVSLHPIELEGSCI